MTISKKPKAKLKRASSDAVARYFANLADSDKRTFWLSSTNRYFENCTSKYEDDLPSRGKPSSVNHADISAYISASGPTHVIDGWSFLGRAIDSSLRNDSYNAIHLAYYAELRAAMALLATEGIGIFNSKHARISAAGRTCNYITQGTHKHVWPCLNYWASCESAFQLIESVFQPAGKPLSTWFACLGAKRPVRAVARQVLRMWGLDLNIVSKDHNLRNQVSYRPSEITLSADISVDSVLTFVSSVWACFEPSSSGQFPVLQRALLRRALRAGKAGVLDLTRLQLVGLSEQEARSWESMLGADDPLMLVESTRRSGVEGATCHLQVIARAALLLALATASARRHLAAAGYTVQHLLFWWQRHGLRRGLWNASNIPDDPVDAWADIHDRLAQVSTWIQDGNQPKTFFDWRRSDADGVELFGAFELVAMWGLMP